MPPRSRYSAYIALLALYFFWGTTYLGIRIALESFPPLFLISSRYLLSGSVMLIGAKLFGATLPRGRELLLTALYGVIMLGGGNGCLTYAELWVPSGLAALFLTTSPFWMVGMSALLPGGERLHWPTVGGIAVGFAGVLLLLAPKGGAPLSANTWKGFAVLQLGCFLWCLGATLQKRQPVQTHPVVGGAVQQLAVGLVYLIPAAAVPEGPVVWSEQGVYALLYLVIFGSVVGYSSFVYSLSKFPVAVVATHTYVNPVVAVWLGWLFYREPFGWRETLAMAGIFGGCAIVNLHARRHRAY